MRPILPKLLNRLAPLVLLLGSVASAAPTGTIGMGPILGFALPNTSGPTLSYGFDLTYKLSPVIGLSGFFMRYGASVEGQAGTQSVTASTAHTFFGLEPCYYFAGSGFRAGAKLGMAKTSIEASAVNGSTSFTLMDSYSNLFIAPVVGYDVPVGFMALGGALSYVFALGDNPPSAILLLAHAKFWF